MNISYNWLKQYLNIDLTPDELSEILTNTGLEVEGVETWESLKGGLKGVVVGEVKTKEKHPDADKLSVTTVDIGASELLQIVCGASNVEAKQKVLVATIGTIVYTGDSNFEIKKSKIRGIESQGMICAEDELGLGNSHAGIMVLDNSVVIGTLASSYFNIEQDIIFSIGLTPNRSDAMSHIGVARDIFASVKQLVSMGKLNKPVTITLPSVNDFKIDSTSLHIPVKVEDTEACPRYSGLTISNVEVKESPSWLKNKLLAIGLRPINNIVDCTNYVLHETGQPLHAFDVNEIKGNEVIVKKPLQGATIVTLDEITRILSGEDLCICNASDSMCIGGVFGGLKSGVSSITKNIFLESAYFDAATIRKTSKKHGLHTDASFRFERGTDPNQTVYALKRAALLIQQVAGGSISSNIIDVYPTLIEPSQIHITYKNIERLIGKEIDKKTIHDILESLDISVLSDSDGEFVVQVPTYRVDVKREADIIEELLRIYGYNNIELSNQISMSLNNQVKPNPEKIMNYVADYLVSNGFNEIMCNSLSTSDYVIKTNGLREEELVTITNPLSSELDVMRQSLIFGGLEAIAYNQNRKNADLKLFEFGKTYLLKQQKDGVSVANYKETRNLAILITGQIKSESWRLENKKSDFYSIKQIVNQLLVKLGLSDRFTEKTILSDVLISEGLEYSINDKVYIKCGLLMHALTTRFDIKNDVYYAEINWDLLLKLIGSVKINYKGLPKFPEVRRDLALLIDKQILFSEIESIAFQIEKKLLKKVNLFDIYEGDKIDLKNKSYAVSFIFQDIEKTLTDETIDKIMSKLIKAYSEKIGAVLR